REQRRLRHFRVREPGRCRFPLIVRWKQDSAKIQTATSLDERTASIDLFPKERLRPVDFRGHVNVLSSLAGKHEESCAAVFRLHCRCTTELLYRRFGILANASEPVNKHSSAAVKRVGNIRKLRVRVSLDIANEIGRIRLQSRGSLRG